MLLFVTLFLLVQTGLGELSLLLNQDQSPSSRLVRLGHSKEVDYLFWVIFPVLSYDIGMVIYYWYRKGVTGVIKEYLQPVIND